jgi:copper chaperone CopZ
LIDLPLPPHCHARTLCLSACTRAGHWENVVMVRFLVQDMTCGHCEATIRKAVAGLDPAAQVRVDLASRTIEVGANAIDPKALEAVIRAAGYTPALTD